MMPEPQPAADAPPAREEELWEQLLQLIEAGRVIPIVGRDLLTVELDGQHVLLHRWLARELAGALQLGAADVNLNSLNAVACAYLATIPEPEPIYHHLHRLLRTRRDVPIPEPLKQLASIRPFKLFVSTTFDSLLTQAINAVRFDGAEKTRVIAYSPQDRRDLPVDLGELTTPVVYHLLGRVSPMQDYVATEEDALEFVHSFQASGLPPNLLSELDEKPLLIIGCSFPGWLVRFFLRAARRNRLLLARRKTDFVADASGREEPALLAFLRNFRTRTEFFHHADAVAFVAELHDRWHRRVAETAPPERSTPMEAPDMKPGAVFLSYASDDRPVVQAIRDALDAAGIDVWFDRDRLMAGDPYENRIRRFIDQASLFIPVLSRSCVTPERRFFRLEWDHAQRIALMAPLSSRFIVPVVIDDLPPDHDDIPERFRTTHWQGAPGGAVPPEFVDLVRRLYREYQSRLVVRA